jgi:hypothetical protein
MDKVFIYGLVDPRTNLIRYIGWTPNAKIRYGKHINESKRETNHKANWIKQLLSLNLKPALIILDEVSVEDWSLAESAWILYGLEQDWPLTNMTLGGEGTLGCIPSRETRNKMRESGKKKIFSDEHRENMRRAGLGKILSKEARRKVSEAMKGENNHQAALTEQLVIEIRELYDSGMKVCDIAKKYEKSYYTIYNVVTRRNWNHIS